MDNTELLQEEEIEVLKAIYEGDPAFNQVSPTVYQYKFGEDNDVNSFLVEISWGKRYPNEKPELNLNTFYNNHLIKSVKESIIERFDREAESLLGSAMTYNLIQTIGEYYFEFLKGKPIVEIEEKTASLKIATPIKEESSKKPKPEQLTKAQKRRLWNQMDEKGEKPRGWNWVDIIKHLSQTGSVKDQES